MTERQRQDAHAIQQGACNAYAITNALRESLADDRQEATPGTQYSAATRLILHQLVFVVTGIDLYATDLGGFTFESYQKDMAAVRAGMHPTYFSALGEK